VRFGWGERKKDFGGAVEGGSEMAPAASSTIFSMLSPCEHVFSAPYASKEQQWQQQHPSTQVSESVSVWFFNLHLILVTPH
jgi:hypothetical protein